MGGSVNFFDSHAHFDQDPLINATVVERAQSAGVRRILAVGGSSELNASAVAVVSAFPEQILLSLGFDRDQAGRAATELHLETLRELISSSPVAAIGEIGLDLHYTPETEGVQRELFAAQLELAAELELPVVVHTREADEATLEVVDQVGWSGKGARGVIHCYTGNREFAAQLLDRHFMISFSGIVTFRNADMLRDSAAYIPAERLLIETDAPYLAPVPQRGKRNEPAFVPHVAECLAEVRGVSVAEIAELTWENGERLFCRGGAAL